MFIENFIKLSAAGSWVILLTEKEQKLSIYAEKNTAIDCAGSEYVDVWIGMM